MPLGIMGTLFKAPLKALGTIMVEGLQRGLQSVRHDAERGKSLGKLHA